MTVTTDPTAAPTAPTAPTAAPTTDSTPHALNRAWCAAFNDRDLDLLMSMYEPDALLVPGPGAPTLVGHDQIRAALEGFLGLGGTLSFTPRFWHQTGDLVTGSIAFVMDGGRDPEGNPVDLRGVTVELARRQPDGSWKYVVDLPFGGSD